MLFTPVYVAAFFAFMNSVEGGNLKVKALLVCSIHIYLRQSR